MTCKKISRIDLIGQNGNTGEHYVEPPIQSLFHDQMKFLQAGDVEVGTAPSEQLAFNLVEEEYCEFINTGRYLWEYSDSEAIKEALDLMYVTAQYLNVTIGADKALACWNALQANNMSKCVDGKLVKREDGKILKPEGYQKLDLTEILNDTSE